MDAVSLETPQENEFVKQRIARGILGLLNYDLNIEL